MKVLSHHGEKMERDLKSIFSQMPAPAQKKLEEQKAIFLNKCCELWF